MYIENSKGVKMAPWGATTLTDATEEVYFPTKVHSI